MKCAIIGSSVLPDDISQEYLTKLEIFGKWLADNNIEVLTGACDGSHIL